MGPRLPTHEELIALVRELRDRVAVLERENAGLRRRLEEEKPPTPPPPSPPPFVKPSLPPHRKHKKPGRPAGHLPAHRPPPPPEVHQDIAVPLPEDAGGGGCRCPHCRAELAGLKDHERVVEDVVPAAVRVTRYRTRSSYCGHCRKRVESRHAEQPPPGSAGTCPTPSWGSTPWPPRRRSSTTPGCRTARWRGRWATSAG